MRWILGIVAGLCFSSALALTGYLGWVYWQDHRKAELFHTATAEASEEVPVPKRIYEVPFSAPLPDGGSAKIIWTHSGPHLADEDDPIEPMTIVWKKRPKKGEQIGTLRIPSIGVKAPMWAGVDDSQLNKGVGVHDLGLPGEAELVGLAGHRETAFQRVGKLQNGDRIILETPEGKFRYKVTRTWITDKDDRSVIRRTGKPTTVGYTCYPFDSPDSPQRFVFEAELVD